MGTYVVEWDIRNVPKFFEGVVKDEFVKAYNKFAEDSEAFYKLMNARYDDLYGKEDHRNNDRYDQFAADEVEKELRDKKYFNRYIELHAENDGSPNIFGKVKGFKNSYIGFFLKEI